MVMALVTMMDNTKHSKIGQSHTKQDENLTPEKHLKQYEARIPEWKKQAPAKGESDSVKKNNKTYHWCKKCHNIKGMWALHKTKEHKGKVYKDQSNTTVDKSSKKVSFQAETSNNSSKSKIDSKPSFSKDDKPSGPSIQVKKDLINNAKAYLAQFQDFHKGGAQG